MHEVAAPEPVAPVAIPTQRKAANQSDVSNLAVGRDIFFQPKLTVGSPNDPLEHEADAVADRVVRMPEQNFVQRKCASCEEEGNIQRKPINSFIQRAGIQGGFVASDAVSNKINLSKGSGSSMDSHTQSFMQSRFGTDFSDVKIHTGGDAIQMNRDLNAKAFTVGKDIYFNEGKYSPNSDSGKHLLAHELTHTVQQGGSVERKVQRDLLVYNSEHSELMPDYGSLAGGGPSMTVQSTVYEASYSQVNSALSTLVTAGKISKRASGSDFIFNNASATVSEIESAFTAAGFSLASEMAAGLVDEHNLFIYSNGRFWRSTTLFWSSEGVHTSITERSSSRPLTSFEKTEAQRVYGTTLSYDSITLHEDPVMSVGGFARTLPNNIYLPPGSFNGLSMHWLIHELMHAWQYEHGVGIPTTLWHAIRGIYDYGGESALQNAYLSRTSLRSFNTEQQADIVADYYARWSSGLNVGAWQPYITELQTGTLPNQLILI